MCSLVLNLFLIEYCNRAPVGVLELMEQNSSQWEACAKESYPPMKQISFTLSATPNPKHRECDIARFQVK